MKIGIKISISLAIIIFIFTASSIIAITQTMGAMTNQASENALSFSRAISERLDQRINGVLTIVATIAENDHIKQFVIESNQEYDEMDNVDSYIAEKEADWRSYAGKENPLFNEMAKNPISERVTELSYQYAQAADFDLFPEIFVTNKYGAAVATNNRLTDFDQSDELKFQNSRDYGWYVSDLGYDESSGIWSLEVASAITEKKEFLGIVKVAYNIQDIVDIFVHSTKDSPYETSRFALISGDDRIIHFSAGTLNMGDDFSSSVDFFDIRNVGEGVYQGKIPSFEERVVLAYTTSEGFREFPGLNWIIGNAIDEDEFLAEVYDLQNTLLTVLAVSIIVAAGIGLGMIRGIIPPIKKIERAAKEISKEKFDEKLEIKSKDEFGSLGESINEMATKLKNIQKEKQELLAMITHELKTPLQPIQGFCEMLKDPDMGELNEDQKEAVDEIYNNSEELLHLIENVLNAQKIELQKLKFNIQEIGVDEFMEGRYKSLLSLMAEKGIKFVNSTEKGLAVKGDIKKLNEIFANLVQNSVDFVPDKNGKIEIGAKNQDKEMLFYVKDNGKGIPKDKIKNLFKKFYQIDSSYTRKHGGSGLGLSICKGYIEGLGGKIWVESEPNVETTFYFTLPRVQQKASFEEYEKDYVTRYKIKKGKKK